MRVVHNCVTDDVHYTAQASAVRRPARPERRHRCLTRPSHTISSSRFACCASTTHQGGSPARIRWRQRHCTLSTALAQTPTAQTGATLLPGRRCMPAAELQVAEQPVVGSCRRAPSPVRCTTKRAPVARMPRCHTAKVSRLRLNHDGAAACFPGRPLFVATRPSETNRVHQTVELYYYIVIECTKNMFYF